MVSKKRSRIDIICAMLEAAQGGQIKARIVSKAYLSFAQTREYFSYLIDKGMMKYDSQKRLYFTTEKGMRFLKSYEELGEALTPKNMRKMSKTA
jgi:predicted transcriptional regulator